MASSHGWHSAHYPCFSSIRRILHSLSTDSRLVFLLGLPNSFSELIMSHIVPQDFNDTLKELARKRGAGMADRAGVVGSVNLEVALSSSNQEAMTARVSF